MKVLIAVNTIDIKIIKELVNNANINSSAIASKYKIPLSTIRRRRARLENSILKKNYSIDIKKRGWRKGELLVLAEKGKSEEVAKKILLKYENNVVSVSIRIDSSSNIVAQIFYKNSEELHNLLESVKAMPYVVKAEWSEIVSEVGNNNTDMLDILFSSSHSS
jgi:DNA-binding Lrp family transcriptional regulator